MWELLTCRKPWAEMKLPQLVHAVAVLRQRLEPPPGADEALAALVRDCCAFEPAARPDFAEIVRRLQ